MKRNLILLTGLFPPQKYEYIINASKGNIQYAADSLQKSLLQGISEWGEKMTVINLPFVGSYPMRFRNFYIPSYSFDSIGNDVQVDGHNVSFCNLMGYKLFSRYLHAKKVLQSKIRPEMENVILVYSVHTPFLAACADVKKKNSSVKIVLVVPDLPEFMAQRETFVRSVMNSVNNKILETLYDYVDGYILLSKYMTERLPVCNKPWTVIEGIYSERDETSMKPQNQSDEKYLLYTGTLAARYGIMNLVKAFMSLESEKIRLYICGDGDSRDEIVRLSCLDKRIVYKGQVRRSESLLLQRNAVLLINPRTPEGEFTKYSFPSKVMEYLASGTPTLMYRLPGIPEEYYEYCYNLDKCDVDSLAQALSEIMGLSESERISKGQAAREFILRTKNPKNQALKIINLLDRI